MARIEHVAVKTITAADVTSKAMSAGRAYVHIADMALYGTIAELRAVAVEIDRQLARLEVEHRIDQAVTKCGTCDDTGEVVEVIGVCPDCGGTGQ